MHQRITEIKELSAEDLENRLNKFKSRFTDTKVVVSSKMADMINAQVDITIDGKDYGSIAEYLEANGVIISNEPPPVDAVEYSCLPEPKNMEAKQDDEHFIPNNREGRRKLKRMQRKKGR